MELQHSKDVNLNEIFETRMREIVREEIKKGSAFKERLQSVLLTMRPNIKEQDAFDAPEQKAA